MGRELRRNEVQENIGPLGINEEETVGKSLKCNKCCYQISGKYRDELNIRKKESAKP